MTVQPESPVPPSRRQIALRTWAALLVLAAIVPLLIFSWITLTWMARVHADAFAKTQADMARVLAGTVDGELRSMKIVLETLAASQALRQGRLAEFYEEARRVAAQQEGWINLVDPDGRQRFNTLRPYGSPLPATAARELLHLVLTSGRPAVSNLVLGATSHRWAIAVAVPVLRDGAVAYVLFISVPTELLTRLLERQQLSAGWTAAIQDSQLQVVTRLPLTDERMGKPIQPWVAAALRVGDHGTATGRNIQGVPVRLVFNRLTEAPWFATLSIPLAVAPAARPDYWIIALGAVLGCAAVALAVYASRKLTRPVAELAARAEELLRGESAGGDPRSAVREIRHLEQALLQAATSLQALHREEARALGAEARAQAEAAAAEALRREITHRQQAERQLRATLESIRDGFFSLDRAWRFTYVNRRAAENLGLAPAVLIGKNLWEAFPAILGTPHETHYRKAMEDGIPVEFEVRGALIPGWYEIRVYPSPEGISVYWIDATARKQAEEAVRNVARFPDENPHPVLRVSREGTLLYANRTSAPLLRLWSCQVGQRLPADWCRQVADACAGGTVTESEVTCEGGRVYSCILTPIAGTDYLNIYARDITARKQAEADLLRAKDGLEQQVQERTAELARQASRLQALAAELTLAEQRERRRLADILHDEHQQLLVGARLRLHLVARGQSPEVQAGCQEVSALLQDVIEHSRSLTRDLSPPLLRTGGLVPALTWLAGWMGEQYQLKADIQADPAVNPATEELTLLLYQAVRELLFNVVKHAQVAAARLTVAAEDGWVRIEVSDAGVGFDPARRLAVGETEAGFGLFSLEQRLSLLGGRLDIASTPGRGSRITLWAPLHTVPAEAKRAISTAEPRPASSRAPVAGAARRLRILLVDDHAVFREGLAGVLSKEPDLEVVGEAADGKQAVGLVRQLEPDLVLMDVSMPVMDGVEATRAIRAEFPDIQVIGLSMFESLEQAQAMREAGAAQYVTKSSATETLLSTIRASAWPPPEKRPGE